MSKHFTEQQTPTPVGDFADPLASGSLNDLLRQKLNQLNSAEPAVDGEQKAPTQALATQQSTENVLSWVIHNAVEEILSVPAANTPSLEGKLQRLFECLNLLYQQAEISPALRKRQFVSQHGLIISPDHCITTQKDTLRVRSFIRAADQAIAKLRTQFTGRLHIVYPACGPFAPLLLPLIAYYQQTGLYDENDLRITLIDIQPGAVSSLETLIHETGIAGYIDDILCQDACHYQAPSPVHLVVLEAMQHGFSKEGHLPMARHFAALLADKGIMLPEEVNLKVVLAPPQQEFVEQWQEKNNRVCEAGMAQENIRDRVELGDILTLNLTSLRELKEQVLDENTRLIECASVPIPALPVMERPMLLICTRITTYGREYIGEYDSGITHPLPDMHVCINFVPRDTKPGDLLVNTGDQLKFYYRLNGLPGFLATVAG
ncbi:hypothetical protein [Thalassomonas haliotis]|uniref:Uncharacterized protein n=1 Tax=Thalassomonas haliotis TaxID=485448 RepID=A0ABY7VCB1_9GAMM|nr:hypothetical protein [Thalassomonas haliotis]WDE11298.1 hypothetical protein H3N35_24260 [Thalassomonas haliotis]